MSSELYVFIIWEKSFEKKNQIFDDIGKKFVIREVYEIKWSHEEFENNLKRFYGSSLPNASQKAELCGKGPFLLFIVSDPNPKIEIKRLDDVNQVEVNTNIYNSKMKYREWVGVDYALHASNSHKETNHDLMLLIGKKSEDLEKELPENWNGSIKKIESELIGHNGWTDMKQFLDSLNVISNYVILRNFEELPDKLVYHDIDILTDNVKIISDLINEEKSAIGKAPIMIGNKEILLDFRYQEGHHYDEKWAKDVLKRRIMYPGGFYVPCNEDYFYTLLYHGIIQEQIRDEYKKTLYELAKKINLNENIEEILNDFKRSKNFLDKYMSKMGYHKTTIYHQVLYKIRHSELIRLVKIAVFLTKTYGIRFLLKKIKIKIRMIKNVK